MLKPNGIPCLVGGLPEPISVPSFALIGDQKTITGCAIAGRAAIREVLDFAGPPRPRRADRASAAGEAEAGLAQVRTGKARYRVVLTA